MAKFAKLFDLEDDEQVLLTLDYDEEEDMHRVTIQTDFDGCEAKIRLAFNTLDKAISALNSYTKDKAIDFRTEIGKMVR
jgi:hypothetical protein